MLNKKILLGSNSPRRKELLEKLGYVFDVVSIKCDEVFPHHLKAKEVASYLSELKANAYGSLEEDIILITADTVVAIGEEILGKPENKEHALQMLSKISGKTHQVYTGITIKSCEKTVTKTDVANVTVDVIFPSEINFYINEYKPFDKAGSYGIQEWLGMAKINKIEGSYYTIMGLPTHLIYNILKDFA